MKYLAILKDSFREALDSKIIYVMFGLSALLFLVAITLTFEPKSPAPQFRMMGEGFIAGLPGGQRSSGWGSPGPGETPDLQRHARFQYVSHQQLSGAENSPDGTYRVTYEVEFFANALHDEAVNNPNSLRQRFAKIEELDLFKISAVKLVAGLDFELHGRKLLRCQVDVEPAAATRRIWPHEMSILFGALPISGDREPLGLMLFVVGNLVMRMGAWIAILISVIITGFFIPNMLRKGTIDLLLVKPIHRPTLLVYKYIGGLTFTFINTAFAVSLVWLALGLRSGIWANSFLLMIFSITFYFAILYAVATQFGVLTHSAVVSILMACGAWFLFFIIGIMHHVFEDQRYREQHFNVPQEHRRSDNAFASVVHAVYKVTPRTADLTVMAEQLMQRDFFSNKLAAYAPTVRSEINWAESLTVSFSFIALMLALSSWRFATRDY